MRIGPADHDIAGVRAAVGRGEPKAQTHDAVALGSVLDEWDVLFHYTVGGRAAAARPRGPSGRGAEAATLQSQPSPLGRSEPHPDCARAARALPQCTRRPHAGRVGCRAMPP